MLYLLCTHFMLQFFRVALISWCIFSMLHFSHFELFSYFHVALFSCWTLSILHFFHNALFSCCTYLCVALFSCCTFSRVVLCSTHFLLHFLRVVIISCCTFSELHFFKLYSFHVAPFFELHFFHVALFSYCTFFCIALFWYWTFWYWTLSFSCCFVLFENIIKQAEKLKNCKKLTVCYYHVTYEFHSESTLYSLPECQGPPCSKQVPYLMFKCQQRDSIQEPLSS